MHFLISSTDRSHSAITRVHELVRRGAQLDGGALITAELGTAVDDIARELHVRSRAAAGPFVVVDCEASEPTRVDRLLFGRRPEEAPSDLEAVARDSAIAAARGGTLFLKHVTELRASAQAQLARIARDGEVRIDGVKNPFVGKVNYISPRAEYTPPVIYSRETRAKLVFMVEFIFDSQAAANLHPGQPVDVQLKTK